jgi:serine/threonine protein kinase
MMVCKYISGGSLPHYLYEQKKMGRSSVWRVLLDATRALQFLQSKGIVHGDLKADNILVDGDKAMLTDFGMSFFVSEGQPHFKNVGAIYWRAPEMALQGKASFESDVYSLGTCIVEALTGDIPWQGIDESVVRFRLRQGELFQKPRTMQKEVWDLVVDMCKFEPSERLALDQVEERVGKFADDELEAECEREGLANEKAVIKVLDLGDLCSAMDEAEPLCRHVFERLRSLMERKVEPTSTGLLLSDFQSLMKQNDGKVAVLRLISAHSVARALEVLHREMDELEPPRARGQWEVRWQNERAAMKEKLFGREVAQLMRDINSASAQELLVLLYHEQTEDSESYSEQERQVLQSLVNAITESLQIAVPREEKWFIPRTDVQVEDESFNRGAFGRIYHGTYMNTHVAVKSIAISSDNDREHFLREVSIWHEASRHPNIVPLFGACHVGDPCFMVCKYIAGGTLPEYLYRQKKLGPSCAWRALLGTTHAIQFLHSKGIVFGDLKGNNIMVEGDTAMLSDFGLSFSAAETQPEFGNLGAIRWRAPEFIATKASFEADVYSLGMCIIEAVTGKLPWGNFTDTAVKWHVKIKKLPKQPESMSDDEWTLVCAMCDFDPSKRMALVEVEKRISEYAAIEEETAYRRAAQAAG